MKATPITVLSSLRDILCKDRKMDTPNDILRHFEKELHIDETNGHAETSHYSHVYPMPVIETANPIVKVTMHDENHSETDNDSTEDDSQNSPTLTKRKK